ncbi:Ser/Thr protein kinase RdoA (MazF antagonist) [Stackebrandtia endophytica]|uniref:Ser/Thr protein kinase RdoA (MazF antagonist) n=1 Tax=Stackebrandtia endophytica TaxID=1496996 RepID=A0A543AQ14_9ACTN|nr:Ser/Thr protein kinase RdoA (MazF antagonist) [Stackebrandtia endophytica]
MPGALWTLRRGPPDEKGFFVPQESTEHQRVFEYFGAEDVPETSCYAWAPVYPCRVGDARVVIKRTRSRSETAAAVAGWTTGLREAGVATVAPVTLPVANPAKVDDEYWVVYPFLDGEVYSGEAGQIAAAGRLLGRIHATETAVTPPPFEWPDHGEESVEEDREGIAKVLTEPVAAAVEPLSRLVTEFMSRVLPPIRDGRLPHVGAVMDYKANNLIYRTDGPVLVDPDNADWAPRILDLALAAMQFHIEHSAAPGRMFTQAEWREFYAGYCEHVELTEAECRLWPLAVEYMLSEYGLWSLIESDEWDEPRERAFMIDLAQATAQRFPLS